VPRPDYIAKLHAAKYDLRFCCGAEKPEKLRLYREVLAEAASQSNISEHMLEAAVARDFGEWVKQEKLPKPPKPN
jgi:hypothetical protein